ncbi:MAG: YciI family protein [Acidimicrobiia bacterium]|nr:YciI family protein [Acidimicrobiia bacterium]
MKYALLIYYDESNQPEPGSEAQIQEFNEYMAFTADINERGINLGGEALLGTEAATTVRVRNDETLATDGPFAETKEALGGFYIIDVSDLDEAISVAAKLPGSWRGSVEVRPVYQWENDAPA